MASKVIPRDDLLLLLSSMGIDLPNTKLSVDELNKKIGLAFDASQQLCTHLPNTPVDPNTFPAWDPKKGGDNIDTDSKTLFEATRRRNVSEIYGGAAEEPKQGRNARKQDTFREMRLSVMGIAYMFDKDLREIFYVDDSGKGILLKIFDVRKVNKDIPLFLFQYKELALGPGAQHPTPVSVPMIDLERRALLKLFQRNTKKLHEVYYSEPQKDVHGVLTHTSFVLPLCPLNMKTLGKLTHNAGCQVCGKKDTSRCLQCLSVGYCSKQCQKEDWPDHKLACKSLKGGTWSTIRLSNLPGKYRTMINRLDPLSTGFGSGILAQSEGDGVPPDEAHKGRIFLAKFQIALSESMPNNMMIYDRQRSFHLLWLRDSNPMLFDRAGQMMADQYKFYRWVRRVGEDEMEVCLDRCPANNPVW